MTLDQKIERILLDAKGSAVSYSEVRRKTDAIGFSFNHAIGRLRKKYGARLVSGVRMCAIVEVKKIDKVKSSFTLPLDLWRGWRAPGAQTHPAYLGV